MFKIGEVYGCEYRSGYEDVWITAEARIVKRTKKTITIEVPGAPWQVNGVHKTYIDGFGNERAEGSGRFLMVAKGDGTNVQA